MDTAKYTALFLAESRDHIQQCNRQLLAWERSPGAPEPVQALFRSIHTLKGMAASLGHTRLASLAHALEHVLGAARDGHVAASPELIEAAFRTVDLLERGVELAARDEDGTLAADDLIAELGGLSRPETGTWPVLAAHLRTAADRQDAGASIRVRLRAGTAMPGARAILALRRLESMGTVSGVQPPPETWARDVFLGEFSCRLVTSADDPSVRKAVQDAGEIEDVVVERGGAAERRAEGPRQVRVDLNRLDALVTLVGELGVARTRVAALIEHHGVAELMAEAHGLFRLVGQLQDRVLQVRMAPVAEVFDRFPRVVRDLSRRLGKSIRLDVSGEDIELDRAILDQLPDLLLHLIRNAADHGLEGASERRRAGKPVEGTVRLSASREGNTVRIDVTDDGRGIDRAAVLARVAAEGWATGADAGAAGDDLLRILARPGFSTAAEVSSVSGRGVGIDAVVHGVRGLGGTTELASRPGEGTTVTLRLPLTLAIIPALLVGVSDERYAVPLGYVAEAARIDADAVRDGVIRLRDRTVPLVDLGRGVAAGHRRAGVILEVGGRRGALLVDTLLGQEDIVVAPLDAPRGIPPWVNGATILSDGIPALVLDPAALV